MKRLLLTFALMAIIPQTAPAGEMRLGLSSHGGWGFSNHDFGGWGGGFGPIGFHGLGPFGFGFFGVGGFDTERLQMRFEDRFDNLMTEYDTGLAEIDDFYNSDEYMEVVDDMERLVDKYDLFVGGAERSVDRLGDIIMIANDDLTYIMDLIAEYEAREDIPEHRLDRIVAGLTHVEDRLTMKVDRLTEQQTTLSENLGTYQAFSTDLSTYLTEIVAAGEETPMELGVVVSQLLAAKSMLDAASAEVSTVTEAMPIVDMPQYGGTVRATAVPEPATLVLLMLPVACACLGYRRRA